MVLLRFAPSPTGPLHLGGLRMALYNHLYARKHGGKWILRIEVTDATRFVPGSVEGIRQALDWAGLEYDYGPGKDSRYAPYYQSERRDLYRSYANKLVETRQAYRCFCSQDKLASIRERLARLGSNNTYDKTCLHLTEEEVARKVKAGEKFTIRLDDSTHPTRPPTHDLVFGHVKDAHSSLATDPILLKSDLHPTYHLASVVDDHEMGITHVLRGEEWLPSLTLHLDLYAHLGLKPPEFAHIPILLNPDGTKMSKRNGDVQVVDYIRRGWEPVALLNWLALAGWGARHEPSQPPPTTPKEEPQPRVSGSHNTPSPKLIQEAPDSTRVMTFQELMKEFDLDAVTQRSSSLDPGKLEYINKHHLMRQWESAEGLRELAERVHGLVKGRFPDSQYTTVENVMHAIRILERRLVTIKDVPDLAPYLFEEPDLSTDEAKKMFKRVERDSEQILESASTIVRSLVDTGKWEDTSVVELVRMFHEERDRLGMKMYLVALRWALTGMKDGPAVGDIMKVIGPERTLRRLQRQA
ncbi:Glutamate--tRNA ligase mitochondrial [Marasmius crinis-equi]|uniref:glutamate--tRNA ligase n=1 Tax=Marasmius crinis-equi TaxID=585013 RepID=A0ABR3EM42_9AGAR